MMPVLIHSAGTASDLYVYAAILPLVAIGADGPKSAQDFQTSDTWHEVLEGIVSRVVCGY